VRPGLHLPLLHGLPRIELAKLTADWTEVDWTPEEGTPPQTEEGDWIYFILQGEVRLAWAHEGEQQPLLILGAGDFWRPAALPKLSEGTWQLTPERSARIGRLPWNRFDRLLQQESSLLYRYLHQVVDQQNRLLQELNRTRRMLKRYAEEVWSGVPALRNEEVAAAAAATPSPAGAPATPTRPDGAAQRPWLRPLVRWSMVFLSLPVGLLLYHFSPAPFPVNATTAILLVAALQWLIGILPDWVTALGAATLVALIGAAKPTVAFSGYANPAWFLLLGVLGLGAGVARSGLLYRIALQMLRLLPPTYRGQSFALALTGLLFTPLLPSANSRSALASPLTKELSEAMQFPPRGGGSAGLAISSFLGFGQMYFLFLNGTNICLLAWSLMPEAARHQITWLAWFWTALPLGLLTFLGCWGANLLLSPPEPTPGVSAQTIAAQLQVLGPLTRVECVTSLTIGTVLLGFVTQPLHQINPAWLAVGGFLFLVAAGVVDRPTLRTMDWGFLLLVGSLVSLADVTTATGLTDQLTQLITPILHPLGRSPFLFLGAVALMTIAIRLAVPIQQAVMVMVVAMLPVATQMGYHPFTIVLVVLALSNTWLLPQSNSMYLTVYSGTDEQAFTHRQVRPLAIAHALVGLCAVLASVPYWHLLGLLPR
jgi:anion transporter